MYDIITKANAIEFFEKVELDNDTTEKITSTKSFSPFHTARARKARGDRRRKAAERHRGQRDGKRHPKRDEKSYSAWSLSQATPSTSKIITRGVDDYLDEIEAENAEAKAQAEAEAKANKEEYLRYLKEERRNALITAAWYLEKAYSLDHMIAGLEDDN